MSAGRLVGKRALVTGAASGIGHATALRFAAEGAAVAVVDTDRAGVDALVAALCEAGREAYVSVADVTREEDIAEAIGAFAATGGLDVVVANAAVQLFGRDAAAADLELDVWQTTLDVNLTGVFLTCKHGIRALLETGRGGSVICTASPTGLTGSAPGFDAYSTSKAGVVGLVRVLAADYGARGIRVNAVVPGFTETALVQSILDDPAERERLIDGIPLRRAGTANEIAAAMLFLASDEASYATGSVLVVDGGATAV